MVLLGLCLSLENYTHFTSPIRRYPDLITHRIIKNALGKNRTRKHLYLLDDISFLGAHCSDTERKAEEAARDIQDFFKCLYMQDKIGKTFKGVISTVTSFGIFVEIENIFVSGLVHIKQLKKDYYHFEPDNHRLYGELLCGLSNLRKHLHRRGWDTCWVLDSCSRQRLLK